MSFGRLTAACLRNRSIVLVMTAVFVVVGIVSFKRLPIEAYPDVTNVQVQIITLFPGHAAEEIERLVTIPIENEMNGIPKRVSMRSDSMFGLSIVTIIFDDDAVGSEVRNLAFQQLQSVTLPQGAQASLSPDSTPVGEILRYTLRAPKDFPLVELKATEDWFVERQLRMVPGVVDVVGFGGPTKQYQVLIDPAKLRSYDLSLKQVSDALSSANKNAGGAYIEKGPEMYVVRGLGLMRNVEDIGSTAIVTRDGRPILIRDLGEVKIGNQLRLGRVGMISHTLPPPEQDVDDDDVIQGIVLLRKGANALDVLDGVRKKIAEIAPRLPDGVRLVPHYDRTDLIERTLHTVRHNMIEGVLLVLLVLGLFLGFENYRLALVVAAVIPLSLLGAFFFLDLDNVPANLISLGAIDFGIIVDSAVVVSENFIRLRAERRRGARHSLTQTLCDAVQEMGRPILFSKSILIAAFIPLYSLQRVEGKIFRPMALTLTFALIAGTILALSVVPTLISFVVKGEAKEREPWLIRALHHEYQRLLPKMILYRRRVVGGAVAGLVIAGITTFFVGSEFLPKLDEGALWIHVFFPQSVSPTEGNRLITEVRKRLASFPEVKTVVSQLGRPDDGTDVNGFDAAEVYVDLKPREEWMTAPTRELLSEAMNQRLRELPGIDYEFSQVIEDNVNEAISGVKGELSVKIFGDDPYKLQKLADQISEIISKIPGAVDVGSERLLGQPQIQIEVDRAQIARAGLMVSDVQSVIETALGGSAPTQILEGERTFDLAVKLKPDSILSLDAIKQIPIFGSNSERLNLGALSDVSLKPGFAHIYREENARRIAVKFGVRGRDLGSLIAEAQAAVERSVQLPKGYTEQWTGSFENQQRALKRLEIVVPITLLVIFFLLYTAFHSVSFAALILLNIPFAAVGGILALPLAGLSLSVSALVGFIALFGVSVQNGVLLIGRIRELRGRGLSKRRAVIEGSVSRVRAVLMTALMAALGLLPAALSHGIGAETSRPFAVVIVGGLFSSTLLTLFLLPLLYPWFEARSERKEPLGGEYEGDEPQLQASPPRRDFEPSGMIFD